MSWFWPTKCLQPINWHHGTRDMLHSVRQTHITAQERSHKYYDYENSCYLLDKMPAISPLTWDEITEPDKTYATGIIVPKHMNRKERLVWFTPKDDDFDEECRRDEELKLIAEKEEKEKLARQSRERELREQREIREKQERQRAIEIRRFEVEAARIEREAALIEEEAYRQRVREREYQLLKERQQERKEQIYKDYANCHPGTNIVRNKWKQR